MQSSDQDKSKIFANGSTGRVNLLVWVNMLLYIILNRNVQVPVSGRNPRLSQLLGGKPRILVLNKADLADESSTKVSEVILMYFNRFYLLIVLIGKHKIQS